MDSNLSSLLTTGSHLAVPVERVLYASVCCVEGSIFEEMQRIRDDALARNLADDVHVALLYQAGWFMEWLEGPSAGIQAALNRLARDPRHRDLRILHRSHGRRRLTQPWSMVYQQGDEAPADFGQRAMTVRETNRHLRKDPAAVWRRVSMPLNAPGALTTAESDAYQSVMVCSARGTGSFDLVRWLSQQHGSKVVHQRFAGASPETRDVATDYVDLDDNGAGVVVRRVVAMARHGLQIGLTQAFLPDYSHLLLLLCEDMARDVSLMRIVLASCSHLAHRPFLVGLGPAGCDHAGLREGARSGGLIYLDCDITGRTGASQLWAAAKPALDISL